MDTGVPCPSRCCCSPPSRAPRWAKVNRPYFQEGKELVLTPPKHGTAIISAVWTHNTNLVVEWVNKDLEVFGPFIGRTSLNMSNANLIVNQTRQSDGGEYRVEINSQKQSQVYTVKVIKKVPKPSVVVRTLVCDPESKDCTFTCEGDPARTDPVTYSWRWDDPDDPGVWEKGLQRVDVFGGDVKRTGSKYVSCRMTNPVSEEESGRLPNPMYKERVNIGMVAAIIILIIVLVVLAGLGFWKRDDIKKKFCTKTESPVVVKSSDLEEGDPAVQPLNEG